MKVNTVEQFKVLDYIKNNFNMEDVVLVLIDRYTIKLTDKDNYSALFIYNNKTKNIEFKELGNE